MNRRVMRGRLYTRIYLHLLGVLLVVGVATFVVFATGWRSAFKEGFVRRLTLHAAELVSQRFDDPPVRDELVKNLAHTLDVDLTVLDADGAVVIAVGEPLTAPTGRDALAARQGFCVFGRGHRMSSAAPLIRAADGKPLGLLLASPPKRFGPPSLLRPALAVGLVLLIVGLAAAPLARRISRPVERLTEATKRFGSGELSFRIDSRHCGPRRGMHGGLHGGHPHRTDELAELTGAWNDMAERIEALVKVHRELLANVSHELRSPLARIRVAVELLPPSAREQARLKDVETDLTELERLIDDVLTASRLEADALPLHLDQVDLRALLDSLAERAAADPLFAGKTVRVEASSDPAPFADADGALLTRALWNLVTNAAKYGAPPIVLRASTAADHVRIEVEDDGHGIAAAERERVFAPFYRADKARTPGAPGEPSQGFGLGLTLARRIASAHRGTIFIEPARIVAGVERGCRFVLELPRSRA